MVLLTVTPYYDEGGITIYHGDCRDVLPTLSPAPDLLLTDPPYEIVATGGGIGARRQYLADIKGFTDCGFDPSLLAPFDNWACFCAKGQLPALIAAAGDRRWMLVTWNKPNPTPLVNGNYLPDTEYIVHAWRAGHLYGEYRDRSRYIVHPAAPSAWGHPNEKPLAVVHRLVKLGCPEGGLVVDPYMGSGTTLRAAKNLSRRAIGIEIEERYCEIAAKRLAQSAMVLSDAG